MAEYSLQVEYSRMIKANGMSKDDDPFLSDLEDPFSDLENPFLSDLKPLPKEDRDRLRAYLATIDSYHPRYRNPASEHENGT
jgi:hypothetical protein